jgi:sortase A
VVQTRNEDEARITLTSCHPRWSASQRIVVTGALVGTRSSPVGEPDPIDAPPGTLAGETIPTSDAPPVGSDGSTPSVTDPEGTPGTNVGGTGTATGTGTGDSSTDDSVDGSSPPSTDPVTPAAGDDGDTTGEDAFAETWFSDKGAFFDIALWALPLVLIAMASSLVSRRLRAFWIGPLLAAAPFVVVLYFFFQNVNRLLPAAF